jgi:hypothetical protein
MAIELEPISKPSRGTIRYGTKGPDKWSFVHDGILDSKQDRTDHEFTIDGKKVAVGIIHARPLPFWQCPSHPDIPEGHDWEWSDAWEFYGVGDGCYILGVYSVRTRKGVYHCWPIVGIEGCPEARQDLREFFTAKDSGQAMLALARAMEHMVRGSALGGYHVDCGECWELFQHMRRSCDET